MHRYYSDFEVFAGPCGVCADALSISKHGLKAARFTLTSQAPGRARETLDSCSSQLYIFISLLPPIRTLEFDLETIVPGKGELLSHIKANEKDVMSANFRQTGYPFAR